MKAYTYGIPKQITGNDLVIFYNHSAVPPAQAGATLCHHLRQDKRLVLLSLTKKGIEADERHWKFHADMIRAAMAQFDEKETQILLESLGGMGTLPADILPHSCRFVGNLERG